MNTTPKTPQEIADNFIENAHLGLPAFAAKSDIERPAAALKRCLHMVGVYTRQKMHAEALVHEQAADILKSMIEADHGY